MLSRVKTAGGGLSTQSAAYGGSLWVSPSVYILKLTYQWAARILLTPLPPIPVYNGWYRPTCTCSSSSVRLFLCEQ